MKIVHVETGRHFYGGAQQVLYIASGLARRGFENVLVCPPGSGVASAGRDAGLVTLEVPCRGDADVAFVWRLRQHLARLRPALVHCHSRRGADFLGGQAAAMLDIPAVVSRRVDNAEPAWVAALRYRKFSRVVAISEAIARVLAATGVEQNKIVVIRSAVDAQRFARTYDRRILEQQFGIGAGHTALACAGQLIPRKGQRYLLTAIKQLIGEHPNLRLVLFGQGPDEHALKRLSADLGLAAHVTFAGFRDDLDDYLGAFDLLVHPALAEGLGVIALKAQAACVPVVASAVGGLSEAVLDRETGLLVPPADVNALSGALRRLLDDTAQRDEYAKAARRHIEASFSIEAMLDAHVALYRQVTHGSN